MNNSKMGFYIDEKLKNKLKIYSMLKNKNMTDVVNELIEDMLKKSDISKQIEEYLKN